MPDRIPSEGSEDIAALAAEANKLYADSSDLYVNLKDKTKRLAAICAQVHGSSTEEKQAFRQLMEFSDTKFSRRKLLDLGYLKIDDALAKAGRQHDKQKIDAVRDAVQKAIKKHPEADALWKSRTSVIADLPDSMARTLLASIGIDFDSLKANAHKAVKEPAVISAVRTHEETAVKVEAEQADSLAKSSKPRKA